MTDPTAPPSSSALDKLTDAGRPELADDELDACGARGVLDIPDQNTADDDVDALVLFADVDWTDEDAVAARKAEWLDLEANL